MATTTTRLALRRSFVSATGIYGTTSRIAPHLLVRQSSRPASSLPTVADPSFWRSLIPKPLRREKLAPDAAALRKRKPKKDWNPATFYIVIFTLIGSMSIQMIALKKNIATFMRQSEVKIGLLREVIEKLQKGEKVDVERVLGTGDPDAEQEWEQVLREIEREDVTRQQKRGGKKTTQSAEAARDPEPGPPAANAKPPVKTKSTANFF